jgi:hypothetical protein
MWRYIKDSLKKNGALMAAYNRSPLPFLRSIPVSDYPHPAKIRLICRVKPYSYTPLCYPKMALLHDIASALAEQSIAGDIVECGVFNGGSAAVIAKAVEHDAGRHIWLFDSWSEEISSILTEGDTSTGGETALAHLKIGSQEAAEKIIFGILKLRRDRIHFIKGWFQETLPEHKEKIGPIAFLHLDCDWYESIGFCLEELYDLVVPGGFIFIDGYCYWKGCRNAVDEFIKRRSIDVKMTETILSAVYFQKPG